jgi:WD40 repeat protein
VYSWACSAAALLDVALATIDVALTTIVALRMVSSAEAKDGQTLSRTVTQSSLPTYGLYSDPIHTGTAVYSCGEDCKVILWDWRKQTQLNTLSGHQVGQATCRIVCWAQL